MLITCLIAVRKSMTKATLEEMFYFSLQVWAHSIMEGGMVAGAGSSWLL